MTRYPLDQAAAAPCPGEAGVRPRQVPRRPNVSAGLARLAGLTPARWSAKPSHGVAPARERRSSFGLWLAAVGLCAIVLSLAGPRLVFSERGAAATAPTVSSVAADGVSAGHRPGFAPNRDAAVRQAAAAGDLSAQTAAEALSLSEEVRRTDADPLTEPRHQQAAFSSFGSSRPALSPAALPGGIPSGP